MGIFNRTATARNGPPIFSPPIAPNQPPTTPIFSPPIAPNQPPPAPIGGGSPWKRAGIMGKIGLIGGILSDTGAGLAGGPTDHTASFARAMHLDNDYARKSQAMQAFLSSHPEYQQIAEITQGDPDAFFEAAGKVMASPPPAPIKLGDSLLDPRDYHVLATAPSSLRPVDLGDRIGWADQQGRIVRYERKGQSPGTVSRGPNAGLSPGSPDDVDWDN